MADQRFQKFLQETFHSPDELLKDHPRKNVFLEAIQQSQVFERLSAYNPQLAGTQPLLIDIPESDLDVLCFSPHLRDFQRDVTWYYKNEKNFLLTSGRSRGEDYILATFTVNSLSFEIFCQEIPSRQQVAYKHMITEGQLLHFAGDEAVRAIRTLKERGEKTEPAFGRIFPLPGDPYEALLHLYEVKLDEIAALAAQGRFQV